MDSAALLQFVVGGGLVAIIGAVIYAYKEIRAGKIAAKKGDLDSLKDILGEQRTEMTDQRKRYDQRITDLEVDLRASELRTRTADATTQALRQYAFRLESALRMAGIEVPEWKDTVSDR